MKFLDKSNFVTVLPIVLLNPPIFSSPNLFVEEFTSTGGRFKITEY